MAELWAGGPIELPHAFTLDGHQLVLPQIPTEKLLGALAAAAWWELLPQAVAFDQMVPLLVRLVDDADEWDYECLWEPATVLFAGLAGTLPRDGAGTGFWPGVRLAATAVVQWPLYSAWCAAHGTPPLEGPLWEVISRVYAFARDGLDSAGLAKLEQQIWAPPPVKAAVDPAALPRHVRDEEAALALASLNEAMAGGEDMALEWRPDTQ